MGAVQRSWRRLLPRAAGQGDRRVARTAAAGQGRAVCTSSTMPSRRACGSSGAPSRIWIWRWMKRRTAGCACSMRAQRADQHRRVRRAHRGAAGPHRRSAGAPGEHPAAAEQLSAELAVAELREQKDGWRPTGCRRALRWPPCTTARRTRNRREARRCARDCARAGARYGAQAERARAHRLRLRRAAGALPPLCRGSPPIRSSRAHHRRSGRSAPSMCRPARSRRRAPPRRWRTIGAF